MKIFVVNKSFFTFRNTESYRLDLLGKTVTELMCERLGAELCAEYELPEGDKAVLYPVYPFRTEEVFSRFLVRNAGSFLFRGGFVVRGCSDVYALSERNMFGFGQTFFSLSDYSAALVAAARENAARHIKNGALVEEGAEVGFGVRLGKGSVVRRGARVMGESSVGENTEIGGGSEIVNSVVGAGTEVKCSVLRDCTVGDGCTVGPNAYLRGGSNIANGCRIGDFVEIKNASVGRGTKIAHLAYVGDADLGECVNIGCGAVFVNYNGKTKSRSRVGDGCFIGSNCNLIAPVALEKGSYVAAGTTLTRSLSCGDFCIGRCRETVKPDRAKDYYDPKF